MFHLNLYTKLLITKSLFPDIKDTTLAHIIDQAINTPDRDPDSRVIVYDYYVQQILDERPKNSQLILELSNLGLTAEKIASLLGLSVKTVYHHRSHPSDFQYSNSTLYYMQYGVHPKRTEKRLPDYSAKQNKPIRYTLFPLVINYTYIEDVSYIETEPISE